MDLQLRNKTVIVMAASQGLGKTTATEFAKEGANVVVSSRNEEQLSKAVEAIKQTAPDAKVIYSVCDVTSSDEIQMMVKKTTDTFGSVDVLVNNAGGPPAGGFDQFSDEDWQRAFELNLLSYIRAIREVLPSMRANGGGHILNFASSSIKQTLDHLLLSNTFRAGIVGLAKSLSQELSRDNILINTLGPGRIATSRVASLDRIRAEKQGVSYEEARAHTEKSIPIGRYGTPEEFAKQAVFLCSGANTYVTGQTLLVDGGLVKAL